MGQARARRAARATALLLKLRRIEQCFMVRHGLPQTAPPAMDQLPGCTILAKRGGIASFQRFSARHIN
jgi:hypothetical protein